MRWNRSTIHIDGPYMCRRRIRAQQFSTTLEMRGKLGDVDMKCFRSPQEAHAVYESKMRHMGQQRRGMVPSIVIILSFSTLYPEHFTNSGPLKRNSHTFGQHKKPKREMNSTQ